MNSIPNNSTSVNSNNNGHMLTAALEYCKIGKVFPIKPGEKIPLTLHGLKDATQLTITVKDYWKKFPNANIGLVCDNLLVVDFDVKSGGLSEGKPAMIAKYGELPRTRVHRTGGGGEHWLYSVPADLNIRPGAGKYGFKGVDMRANDSYILVPPSVTTGEYSVIDDSPIAPAPQWLIDLAKNPQGKTANSNTTIAPLKEGQRHVDLIAFIGKWRARGFSETEIETQALALNRDCANPLSETEVLKMVSQYAHQQQSNDNDITNFDIVNINAPPDKNYVEHLFLTDNGPIIPMGTHTTFFSQGGSGKSITNCDYLPIIFTHGIVDSQFTALGTGNVLVCDWEADAETHRRYITAIKNGLKLRNNIDFDASIIHYQNFSVPLPSKKEFIKHYIEKYHIDLLVIDSQMASMAGEIPGAKDEERAGMYYNILNSFGITTVTIDHVPKAVMNNDSGNGAAFGSVVKYNRARSVFEMKQAQEAGENVIELAFIHQKNNIGPKLKPFGVKITFNNIEKDGNLILDSVFFDPLDLSDSANLEKVRPLYEQMRDALLWDFNGKATVRELSERLEKPDNQIRSYLSRHKKLFIKLLERRENNELWGVVQNATATPQHNTPS